MKTNEEILAGMSQFYGTEVLHRYSPLFRNVVLSDGAKYVAEECEAYWLMDMIASQLRKVGDPFAIAVLIRNKTGSGAKFTIVEGIPSACRWAVQKISFTDFPLPEIKLYIQRAENMWTILLPSEY